MSKLHGDLAVLNQAIANEQLPPLGRGSKKALMVAGGVFVLSIGAYYLHLKIAGLLVTGAVVLALVVLALSPAPRKRNHALYASAVSDNTIQMLLEKLSPQAIGVLRQMSGEDSQALLRVDHLVQLAQIVGEQRSEVPQAAWRKAS